MTVNELIDALNKDAVEFTEVMAVIDAHYQFTETSFKNGEQTNQAGQNNGSCKIFAFAKLNGLNQQATLRRHLTTD